MTIRLSCAAFALSSMKLKKTTMFNNMSYFFRFSRNIDSQKLQQAVIAAIHNHPALAMKIIFDDDHDFCFTL